LAVGDFCRFHQNSLDKNLFEVEITRPITLWSRWRRRRPRRPRMLLLLHMLLHNMTLINSVQYMWSIYLLEVKIGVQLHHG
jgi:hypothetical protein